MKIRSASVPYPNGRNSKVAVFFMTSINTSNVVLNTPGRGIGRYTRHNNSRRLAPMLHAAKAIDGLMRSNALSSGP